MSRPTRKCIKIDASRTRFERDGFKSQARKFLYSDDDRKIYAVGAEDGGQGLFTRRKLQAVEFVCAYRGKPLLKKEYEKLKATGKNAYCFTDGKNLLIDAIGPLNSGKAGSTTTGIRLYL